MHFRLTSPLLLLPLTFLPVKPCLAADAAATSAPGVKSGRSPIPDEWTASVLPLGGFAVGSLLEAGASNGLMVGSDPSALAFGARTVQAKWQVPSFGEDDWAIGVKYISASRKSLWWGDMGKRFSKLRAEIVRPSVSWSNRVSQRLIIHSFWASGFGHSEAELSPYGKEKLYEAKHGTGKSQDGHSFANRTMQLQSIAGFTEDRFQITAEWERNSGERILLSSRFERTRLEQLETFSMRFTLAQQWNANGFNLRLGGGPQYSMLSGKDLDGEDIKTAGWLPAADFAMYWIL
ncbi:MAG: hypothetical protein WCO71_04045 [Pseudomonadota bacterium]